MAPFGESAASDFFVIIFLWYFSYKNGQTELSYFVDFNNSEIEGLAGSRSGLEQLVIRWQDLKSSRLTDAK